MKVFVVGLVGALLIFVLGALVWPQYSNYTARAKAIEWLALVRPIQAQIEAEATKQRSFIDVGSRVAPPSFAPQRAPIGFQISPTGEILILDKDVMLLLTPSLDITVPRTPLSQVPIAWRCVGAPVQNLPAPCRSGPF